VTVWQFAGNKTVMCFNALFCISDVLRFELTLKMKCALKFVTRRFCIDKNVHLFDMLSAILSGKVGDLFLSEEW